MTQGFDYANPVPPAQQITHVGDGGRREVRVPRHAADVGPQGIAPDAELDDVMAWDALCAGVGSDQVSGSNIFVSLDEDALHAFEEIAKLGTIDRLRIRPIADSTTRSMIEISGAGSSAALILTTATLQAARFGPKRMLLTLPGTPLLDNDLGLIGEALQAASRNVSALLSTGEMPDAAFGEVRAAFELPS